jgi:hypothetical protein
MNPMLLILIPIAWLAISAFVVVLCRCAATADAVLLTTAENVGVRATPHTAARSRVTANRVWRRPDGHPAPRTSAMRLRGTRVGH